MLTVFRPTIHTRARYSNIILHTIQNASQVSVNLYILSLHIRFTNVLAALNLDS